MNFLTGGRKNNMTQGEVEYAERVALNNFDKWNDVAGVVQKHTGYYYEIQSVIIDSVHAGIQMAIHGDIKVDTDGGIIINKTP